MSTTSLKSRRLAYCLKNDEILPSMPLRLIDYVAKRIADERKELPFGDWLTRECELVPVPRSSLIEEDALWPARRIATALVEAGLGKSVLSCLERRSPLLRASHVRAEDRPAAEKKLESLRVLSQIVAPRNVVIVDDVITTGASMIAAWSLLAQAFPDATIRAFAIVRTISPGEVELIRAPCVGRVHMEGSRSVRRP